MVKLILATDNVHHFQLLKKMESYRDRTKSLNRGEVETQGGDRLTMKGNSNLDEVS